VEEEAAAAAVVEVVEVDILNVVEEVKKRRK
jgi:hypothetical protein